MKYSFILDSKGEKNPSYGFLRRDGSLDVALFDPWTGKILRSGYTADYLGVLYSEFNGEENGNEDKIKLRIVQRHRDWKATHSLTSICNPLKILIDRADENITQVCYMATIRTYAILSKEDDGTFEAMDYCPFCGAKLPERLDDKLTEILQKKYGLESWKDYKKAPKEFHTNEWWKKRGL